MPYLFIHTNTQNTCAHACTYMCSIERGEVIRIGESVLVELVRIGESVNLVLQRVVVATQPEALCPAPPPQRVVVAVDTGNAGGRRAQGRLLQSVDTLRAVLLVVVLLSLAQVAQGEIVAPEVGG